MGLLPNQVPLVIGVTGHRDLRPQDVPQLEREIETIITRLREDYFGEEASTTPFVLVSALAEGADRLVARVALAMGVKLIAPLPLPIDEYRKDFEPGLNANASAEFDQLLSQATSVSIMPFTPGNSPQAVGEDPDKRAEQYRAVGLFIVQNCDVLIALWDGNKNDMAAGGTGEVVTLKRRGIPLVVSGSAHASLDGSEIGPVIHVVTPRMKAGSPAFTVAVGAWGVEIIKRHRGGFFRRRLGIVGEFCANLIARDKKPPIPPLPPDEGRDLDAWEGFGALVALTREFNSEATALTPEEVSVQEASSINGLFIDPDDGRINEGARKRAMSVAPQWSQFFGIADTLAKKRQAQFKRDWGSVFILSVFAFVFFVLAGHGPRVAFLVWLIGYVISLSGIYAIILRVRKNRDQERFLDYRALAEALRVAVYWNILGIDADRAGERGPAKAATISNLVDHYPIKQPSELAWVRICLRSIGLCHHLTATSSVLDSESHQLARRLWVYGQLIYFRRQGTRYNRDAELLESWAKLIFFATLLFLIPFVFSALRENQILNVYLNRYLDEYLSTTAHDFFLAAIGILPGIAAILTSCSERLGLTAQARQYDRMRMLFQRAYDLLPETFDAPADLQVHALYRELGIEAMKESADWVAIYRQRPIAPV